jgi:hypothetical protein
MPKNITTGEGISLDPKCLNDLRRGDKVYVYMNGYDHLFSIIKFRGKCCIGKLDFDSNYYTCDNCNKKIRTREGIYTCNGDLYNDCNFHICWYCRENSMRTNRKTCPKNHEPIKCNLPEIIKFPKWAINCIDRKSKNAKKLEKLYSLGEYIGLFVSDEYIEKLPKHWV